MEEEPVAGTLPSDQTDLSTKRDNSSPRNTTNSVQTTQTTTRSLLDDPAPAISGSNTSLLKPTSPIKTTSESKPSTTSNFLNSSQQSKAINSTKPVENNSSSISFVNKTSFMETKQAGSDQVSASLPRSYQRSDSSRLTSVVTPRPFGTQANRVTSLPRTFTVGGHGSCGCRMPFFHQIKLVQCRSPMRLHYVIINPCVVMFMFLPVFMG